MDSNLIAWIVGQIVVAAAIWGGIRADIRSIHSRVERVEKTASDAHERLDRHIDRG